jgi:large subunit ribosomal protein L10
MISLEDKKQAVARLTEKIKGSTGIYLADFLGINVELITELRAALREQGATMIVAKNTLMKRVFKECSITGLDEHLVGPTSLILGTEEDPIAPAKIIADFQKKNEDLLPVKIVKIEAQTYDGGRIKELSKMPGKREIQAQVVSQTLSPGAVLIGLLKGPASMIAGQIESLIEKLESK